MRIIVSKTVKDIFSNFVVVDSLAKVATFKQVSTLIINTYTDSDVTVGVTLQRLRESGVKHFIYINKRPSQFLRLLLTGIEGYTYTDEFYLEDEGELMSLVEEIESEEKESEYALTTTRAAVDVLTDFVQAFTRGEARINSPIYLNSVNDALSEIVTISEKQQVALQTMGSSALDVFTQVSKILTNLEDTHRALEEKLKLAEERSQSSLQSRGMFTNALDFFPTVSYSNVTQKMLLVREYSPCRFLTSFVLGYQYYLQYACHKRVKLIFVHQKGAGVSAKYDNFTTKITQDNVSNDDLFDSPIISTNNPKKSILSNMFNRIDLKMDLIIVVDRLYGSTDIVSGSVTKVNAVSGESDIERFKLNPKNTIFSVTKPQTESLLVIMPIRGYPKDEDARRAAYDQLFRESYELLNKKVGI